MEILYQASPKEDGFVLFNHSVTDTQFKKTPTGLNGTSQDSQCALALDSQLGTLDMYSPFLHIKTLFIIIIIITVLRSVYTEPC